ncbi:MAG: hypothetical protein KGZ80_05315 [Methylomonas sp.]|nr:hypothetical protein [Methylomonas sp.]PPD19870.1 MAG: hypothetical protein CTY23_10485 [Methylomonas sp.]PPD25437.1 MAG: hypothetical protein CTY22_08615 [Methylomonas sp.]PPD36082.1 MAG: hypothetical protein CTY21_08620 [Methylomonas sp.]PPD39405.1 MAG: hypothetical protein CTY17_08170 [Methylomonas sp.]
MTAELVVNSLIQIAGTGAVFYLAFRSCQKRRIQLGDEPTLPQYFSRPSIYWVGISAYCAFMAAFYWVLTAYWLPLDPLMNLLVANLRSWQLAELMSGLDGATIAPLIAAVTFLFLIAWENRVNPLLILRDSIHDAFAIPTQAIETYNALMSSKLSAVDDDIKRQIAERLLVESMDPGDFDKASTTVEYKWAHNCLLFDQIQQYANQWSFNRFFNEPSLKWGAICINYNAMSEKVIIWKKAEPHYTKTLNLLKELDQLKSLLCRLLACLVVFGSQNENELWSTVKQLGGNVHETRLKHTYKYILMFAAAIAVGVILGRECSVLLHNTFLAPDKPLGHFKYTTLRWIVYAIAIYILPITLVFVARTLAFRRQIESIDRPYGFYLTMTLMGFLVSALASTLILEWTLYRRWDFDFIDSLVQHMRWGILPGLVSGFVAYRMDAPFSGNPSRQLLDAATTFTAWGTLAIIIMLYATDDMTIPEPNLRFTLVGTAFFTVGLLCASARFRAPQQIGGR